MLSLSPKWTTSHLKNESLTFVNTLYSFFLPVTSSPHQKSTWLALPQGFIQRSTVAMRPYLSIGCLFFLNCTSFFKTSIHWFPFSPTSSVPLPTLSLLAHLSLGPAHVFAHRTGILRIAAAPKEKRRSFAGAVQDS